MPESLSYAEGGEDDIKDALDIDLADDVAKSQESVSNFKRDEFRSLIMIQGRSGGPETLGTAFESGLVPCIDGNGMIRSERSSGGNDIANGIA